MLQLWDFSFLLFRVVLEAKDIVKVVSIFFDGLYNRGVPVVVNQMKIFRFLWVGFFWFAIGLIGRKFPKLQIGILPKIDCTRMKKK